MKVEVCSLTDEAIERRDYSDALCIYIDGVVKFEVYDGEKEDNNLSRNFSDCYRIDSLMQLAYKAGKNGEDFIVEYSQVDEI